MFDEPTSMPMHAAIASALGGCFGIALILLTHSASAQTPLVADVAAPAIVEAPGGSLRRLGDAASQALRPAEPTPRAGSAGIRGLRINDGSGEGGSGLRWQVARLQGLRSECEIPRSRDLVSVGVQVRF